MSEQHEGRKVSRSRVGIDAELETTGNRCVEARARDVSLRGCYLACAERLSVGAVCKVYLYLGEGDDRLRIGAKARVVRCDDQGMGLEFVEVALDGFEHLRQLILYNADEPERVTQEFEGHIGLNRREPD